MTSAAWAWLGLAIGITGYVVAYDVWAITSKHVTMSSQFHTWLQSGTWGAIAFGLWFGVGVGLMYHFFRS